MGASGKDENAPAANASLDELMAWVGHATPKAPATQAKSTIDLPGPTLEGRVMGNEKTGKKPRLKGMPDLPPAWLIALAAIGVYAVVQFIAGILMLLGMVALGVGILAAIYAIGKGRSGK